jgi:hypothetical protein
MSGWNHDVDGFIEASWLGPEVVDAVLFLVKFGEGVKRSHVFRFHLDNFVSFAKVRDIKIHI